MLLATTLDYILLLFIRKKTPPFETLHHETTQELISMVLFICVLNNTPPHIQLFPFLYKFLLVFFIIALDFQSCRPCFFCLSPKEIVSASRSQLWKVRKESYHPLITGITTESMRIFQFPHLHYLILNQPRFTSQNQCIESFLNRAMYRLYIYLLY